MHTVSQLNVILAQLYALYTKVWGAHWNFVGPSFNDRHKFFGDTKDELGELVDEIAERIRALDGFANASLSIFNENSLIEPIPEESSIGESIFDSLLEDYNKLITGYKNVARGTEEEHDFGSTTLLQDHIVLLEKRKWMIKSNLTL